MSFLSQPTAAPQTDSPVLSASIEKRSRLRLFIPLLLVACYVAQSLWFIGTQSFTWDEPLHIHAGLEEWRRGSFRAVSDHPPLGHLLPTVFAAHTDAQFKFFSRPGIFRVDGITPDPVRLAWQTRPINLALGVLLAALIWITARRMFSEGAANFALALFAFSPALIAHYSMVTTDGVTTLMIFVTALTLVHWRRSPSWQSTVLLGVVLGLLLLSKMHMPTLALLTLCFVLLHGEKSWRSIADWNWRPAGAAFAIALLVLWGGYFFHVSHFTTSNGTLYLTFPPDPQPAPINLSVEHNFNFWAPAGEYFAGIERTFDRNQVGHSKFVLGTMTAGRAPAMQYVVILLKWPPVVLFLVAFSAALLATRKLHLPPEWKVLVAYPAAILALAMISRIALGERHLLPVYPFALLFASATWEFARRSKSSRKAVWIAALVACAALNAADVLRYAPDYLSYFTPFVSSHQSYRLLSDSNMDWGQGLLALQDYQRNHPAEQIYLAYAGSVNPVVYGIHSAPLEPKKPHTGTIVVSATMLANDSAKTDCDYCWVQKYPLKTVLNHSMFVYEVPAVP